jgi:hypothetical protein
MVEGYRWRRVQQLNDNATQAWLISRLVWAEKVELKSLLIETERQEQKQTTQDIERVMRSITIAMGGTVTEIG